MANGLVGLSVGNFRVEERLGGGGMGDVYLLRHKRLPNTLAALKVLRADRVALPDVKERFVQEALVAAAVGGDRVARPIDLGRFDNGAPYIIFELAPGQTLAQLLASGPLSVATALRIAFRVADTMALVHARGIVHRDLKPSNLMIDEGLDDPRVRLLDFGVARAPADLRLAQTIEHAIVGSPGYMSPEAAIGNAVDAKSDVFSLGATLFRCLTGEVPFASTNIDALLTAPPPPIAVELPDGVEALVTRMLAKRGDDRPTMADVRDALAKVTGLIPSDVAVTASVGPKPDDAASTITLGLSAGPAVDLVAIREQLEGLCNDRLPTRPRRWGTLALAGGLAIAGIAAAGWMLRDRTAPDPCGEQAARMDPIWNAAARARFAASDDLGALGTFARDWGSHRVEACRVGNTAIRRTTCLDRALEDFSRIVERPPGKFRLPIPSLLGCANPHDPRARALGFSLGDAGGILDPTATRIAFVRGRELRIAALDGTEAAVADVGEGMSVRAWPSPARIILFDSQKLVAYDPRTKTVDPWIDDLPNVVAISGDAESVLTLRNNEAFIRRRNGTSSSVARFTEATQVESGAFSPDGKQVAVATWIGSTNAVTFIDIATRQATTEPYRTVVGLSGGVGLAWLDNERVVVNVQLDANTGEGLLVAHVRDGRLLEPLAPFLDAQRYTAISPRSLAANKLLAVRYSVDQHLVRIRNGQPSRIPHATQSRILTGQTDDGRMLIVRDEDTGWMTPDGQYTRVGTNKKEWLSTNGTRILVDSGKTLDEIDQRGHRRVVAQLGGDVEGFSQIACGREACAVIRRTPTSITYRILRGDALDPPKPIALTSWAGDGYAMSPDDRRLAFVDRSGSEQQIVILDLASGQREAWRVPPRTHECGFMAQFLVWSPDGLYVSMLCKEAAIQIFRVERDRDPVLFFSSRDWIGGFAIDRDGSMLANVKQTTYELLLIEEL